MAFIVDYATKAYIIVSINLHCVELTDDLRIVQIVIWAVSKMISDDSGRLEAWCYRSLCFRKCSPFAATEFEKFCETLR
jgi:hypothetical protein